MMAASMRPPAGKTLTRSTLTRRSFVRSATALAAVAPGLTRAVASQAPVPSGPLFAYVGTYSCAAGQGRPAARQWAGHPHLPCRSHHGGADACRRHRARHESERAGVRRVGHARLLHQRHRCRRARLAWRRCLGLGDGLRGRSRHGAADAAQHRGLRWRRPDRTPSSILPGGTCSWPTTSAARSPCCRSCRDGRLGAGDRRQEEPRASVGPTRATHAPPGSFAISGHDRTHAHMIRTDPAGRFVIAPTSVSTASSCGSSTRRPGR